MSSRRYKVVEYERVFASATNVELKLPGGSQNHIVRMSDATVPFKYSQDATAITAGNGFPMLAGEALTIEGPVETHSIFFRQVSGGPIVLHWAYEQPTTR